MRDLPIAAGRFHAFVIMGAAVLPGGLPSGALARRVSTALSAARGCEAPLFLATGGVGRHPPSEAAVMRSLLVDAGMPPEQVLLDEESMDTLDSIRACARILRSLEEVPSRVSVCTDRYHVPRCRLLFRLAGVRTVPIPIPSDRAAVGSRVWLRLILRELLATPVDALLLLLRGRQ